MTQGVVDDLEAVQVDEQQGQAPGWRCAGLTARARRSINRARLATRSGDPKGLLAQPGLELGARVTSRMNASNEIAPVDRHRRVGDLHGDLPPVAVDGHHLDQLAPGGGSSRPDPHPGDGVGVGLPGRSGTTICAMDRPCASAIDHPNRCSAAAFQPVIRPCWSVPTTASGELAAATRPTWAELRAASSDRCRPVTSTPTALIPTARPRSSRPTGQGMDPAHFAAREQHAELVFEPAIRSRDTVRRLSPVTVVGVDERHEAVLVAGTTRGRAR